MTNRLILVWMVDGLRATALGAYGNTSYTTPALDQLASESLVLDRYLAESTSLSHAYDAMWSGRHAINWPSDAATSVIAQLRDQGYLCHLVTDDTDIANRSDAECFDTVTFVEHAATEPAAEVFDTAIGRVLERAADILGEWSAEYEQPRLLWVHLRGLTAAWDAPPELAATLRDEDDPELVPSIEVPSGTFDAQGKGADDAFLAGCRYAGQVVALDRCFGAVDDLLDDLFPDMPVTTLLAGVRAFALGEHGVLGIGGTAHRELFHLPLFIRGEGIPGLQRHAGLMQPSDLCDSFKQLATEGTFSTAGRQIAVGVSGSSRYLETANWSLVSRDADDDTTGHLYVQPDDRWQANDVASLCHAEIEQLTELAQRIATLAAKGQPWDELQMIESEIAGPEPPPTDPSPRKDE